MLKQYKSDILSGFLVFLIALPLCLGIAKASDFPPIAGIYTAVIGGLVVTFFSSSPLTIKGPAAGLIAVAFSCVQELSQGDHVKGYQLTLAVLVVSGVLQIIFGLLKSGSLSSFFPSAIIHGMLAAIGVIIISKQIHVLFGVAPSATETIPLFLELPQTISKALPDITLIGLVSLGILFLHPLVRNKAFRKIPAPLLVLIVAIPLGLFFDLAHKHDYGFASLHFHIDPKQVLVALPNDFFGGFTFPDFSQIFSATSIKYIIMFSLVGSIESMLSTKAIDTLDPEHRKTNMNQDLVAIGIGNTVAAFIGGLPMISEIVRSSNNINNGAKSKMSNFFHGLFLFLFVLLAAPLIQKIPNSALAAMLVYTGFRLASPNEFSKIKSIGYDQLFLFLSTLIITLLTDLLVGVLAGILLKLILQKAQGVRWKEFFGLRWVLSTSQIELIGIANFLNFLKFNNFLMSLDKTKSYNINFSHVKLVDHSFMENLYHTQLDFVQNGGNLELGGFENHHFMSKHIMAARKKVINPLRNVEQQLSKRQQRFKDIADELKCDYEFTIRPSVIRPNLSPFSILNKFRNAKHLLICNNLKFNLLVADVEYNRISDFNQEIETATIAILNHFERATQLPDFYMEKSGILSSSAVKLGMERVEIKDFSDWDIYSNDIERMTELLSNQHFVSALSEGDYSLESKRGSLMIHKDFEYQSRMNLRKLLNYSYNIAFSLVK